MGIKPINIFLVEDNEGDILLTTEALEEAKIVKSLKIARDGAEAIEILYDFANNQPEHLPDLILLDINLPKKNGYEVIACIKKNARLSKIPYIFLTTSSTEFDFMKANYIEDNCYLVKPSDFDEFSTLVVKIEEAYRSIKKEP